MLTVGKRIGRKLNARETSKGMKSIIDNVNMTGLILFAFIAMLMIALKKWKRFIQAYDDCGFSRIKS